MQTITRHIDGFRTKRTGIRLHWIPAHTNIRGNEEADIAAKEATRWRRARRRNGKWREWDSGYTAERHELGRARATIKLALEQKTLELWEEAWSSEKTGRELYAICPKPIGIRLRFSSHTTSATLSDNAGPRYHFMRGETLASCHQFILLLLWSVQVFIILPEGEDCRQHLHRRFLP